MDIEPILVAIERMSPAEREMVRARLAVLDGGTAPELGQHADSDDVRRAAEELMRRFPESMRKLAGT